MSPDKHIVGCFRCVCVCAVQTQIKFSVFHSIYILMFMYLIVCYFTGLFYAVIRQISMLFIDNKDSGFCTSQLSAVLLTWKTDESVQSASSLPDCLRKRKKERKKEKKLLSVPLFSPSYFIVILLFPASRFTFSVDYRKFRTRQRNWFSNYANVTV